MSKRSDPTRRAERFLRWYPPEWRARYGDEFRELLVSAITDEPRRPTRDVDVVVGGLLARLADAGLVGTAVTSTRRAQRSLATLACVLAVFMTVAGSMWSQLNIARSWSQPATSATHTAIVIMTIALFAGFAIAAIGAAPVVWQAGVAVGQGRTPGIWKPALMFWAGVVVLVAGGLHFRSGWAGPGTHPWAHRAMGPDGVLAFLWASTLAVSAYWAHPTILLSFPISEITWMVFSPIALVATVTGAAKVVRRIDLTTRTLRFTTYTARATSISQGLFLFGTLMWLLDGGPGPHNLFQAGTVDLIGLAIMATTLAVAIRSVHRIASCPPLPIG
jgi:hypothetical protein